MGSGGGGAAAPLPVPCFGGVVAHAHFGDGWRMGGLSKYPLMDDLDSQTSWGLAGQSFPFCFWSEAGDWGFLQWVATDEAGTHAHPAMSRDVAIKSLGAHPPFGHVETFARLVAPGCFVVLRRMLSVPPGWKSANDRLRVLPGSASDFDPRTGGLCQRPGGGRLFVQHMPLEGAASKAIPQQHEGWLEFGAQIATGGAGRYAGVWIFSAQPVAPTLRADAGAAVLTVAETQLVIQPWSDSPLGAVAWA